MALLVQLDRSCPLGGRGDGILLRARRELLHRGALLFLMFALFAAAFVGSRGFAALRLRGFFGLDVDRSWLRPPLAQLRRAFRDRFLDLSAEQLRRALVVSGRLLIECHHSILILEILTALFGASFFGFARARLF